MRKFGNLLIVGFLACQLWNENSIFKFTPHSYLKDRLIVGQLYSSGRYQYFLERSNPKIKNIIEDYIDDCGNWGIYFKLDQNAAETKTTNFGLVFRF